jgi:hypothetical protein
MDRLLGGGNRLRPVFQDLEGLGKKVSLDKSSRDNTKVFKRGALFGG